MEAHKINLLEFIESSKRTFNIPVYQRNYDWKTTHCERLFEDIEKIAKDEERESHFLGTIVYVDGKRTANFREFIVIDGQQRLTSTMLLLKALTDEIVDDSLREDIIESYLINKRAPEELRIKLKPIESDSKIYKKLINDMSVDKDTNIYKNYECFKNLIYESDLSAEQIYQGMHKLEIVYIQLEAEKENPQLIFESLNSTGLELTQGDLIRNYLLMGQKYELQERLYNQYWVEIEKLLSNAYISDFIRDYLTLKTHYIPNKSKVYEEFKIFYERLKVDTPEKLLNELLIDARYYSWFINCNSGVSKVDEKLSQIDKLKSKVVYPFLLHIFRLCYKDNHIEENELINILDLIISYTFRRLICEIPTNALNKIFCSITKEIDDIKTEVSIYEKTATVLLAKSGKGIFPTNDMLKDYMLKRDFYNFKQCKFFLYNLEKYNNKEVVENDQLLTIEHIMPQNLTPKWTIDLGKKSEVIHKKYINTIGNLTLTGYNSELSNDDFDSKKIIYSQSNIKITRDLLKFDSWNEESINKRANEIYGKTINIWKYPEEIFNSIAFNKEDKKEFEIMDEVNVTGREVCELNILSEKISVNTWKKFFEEICKKLYEYDSGIFMSLTKHKDFKGKSRRIITNNKEELRSPYKVGENVYIEQNLSANAILNYSKLIVDKYDGFDNEITYRLK